MRINNFLATVLLLLSAAITADFAVAAGNSIDDGFDALDKAKGGSKTTGQGIDAGFGSLDKGKGSTAAGHSIEAGFQDVAAQRAKEAAGEEEKKRIRMEQEAKKQDQDMEKDCHCVYNNCDSGLRSYSCRHFPGERRSTCAEQEAEQREAMDEQDRIRARERRDKKPICDAWKAAGPTASSASFKAQLRQQDDAIAAAQRAAADAARQRDALIEADIKKNMAQEENTKEAERKAAENAVKAARAAEIAKNAAAEAAREKKERQWCMADRSRLSWCRCAKYDNNPKAQGCMK